MTTQCQVCGKWFGSKAESKEHELHEHPIKNPDQLNSVLKLNGVGGEAVLSKIDSRLLEMLDSRISRLEERLEEPEEVSDLESEREEESEEICPNCGDEIYKVTKEDEPVFLGDGSQLYTCRNCNEWYFDEDARLSLMERLWFFTHGHPF